MIVASALWWVQNLRMKPSQRKFISTDATTNNIMEPAAGS